MTVSEKKRSAPSSGSVCRRLGIVQFPQTAVDLLEQGFVAWIPVFDVTGLAGLIEIAAGFKQPVGISVLHDLEDFQADIPSILAFHSTGSASSLALI